MINGTRVTLRPKRLTDARQDYSWQTDLELTNLDAAPLLTMSFGQYLLDYDSQLRHPLSSSRRFAIETADGKHIGNCTYYNINQKAGEAELGIMIGDRDCWNRGYGSDAVTALLKHIFLRTKLKRIYLKTLEWNARAQACFSKCGFTPCGRLNRDGYRFVLMELRHEQWDKIRGVKDE
ncbi:MAG: GNAT family N-acetyltransferase [Chloroflexota bacterium]